MRKLICAAVVAAVVAAAPVSALGEPGGNGPPGPEGNPNAGVGGSPPAVPGKPTTPPGNSGQNPHGGPPGITGQHPSTPASDNASNDAGGAALAPGGDEPAPPRVLAAAPAGPGGRGNGNANGPGGKITICHATGSATNPYVRIEISVNGLNGHLHHEGDIIPAPEGPCTQEEPGDRGRITICHATGSATNPYVRIEISVNGLNGHLHHEGDIIPAPDGPCSGDSPDGGTSGSGNAGQGVLSAGSGGGPNGAQAAGPDPDGGPSGHAGGGKLPFTGLFLGGLLLVGTVTLAGGLGLRRGLGATADDE